MALKQPRPKLLVGLNGFFIKGEVTASDVSKILESLKTQPVTIDAVDTAALYPPNWPGKSETLLGEAGIGQSSFAIDTKVLMSSSNPGGGELTPEKIETSMKASLERLKLKKVRIYYAHRPDPVTPIAETVRGFAKMVREGKCEMWGVSNFTTSQLCEVLEECETQGLPKPRVYEGEYNLISRAHEAELFALLREHRMFYHAYSPTAGGFLSGLFSMSNGAELPTRFRGGFPGADKWRAVYDKPQIHAASKKLGQICEEHGISLIAAALRWIAWNSPLGSEDGIIIGASSMNQLDQNAAIIAQGPLPERLIDAVEDLWGSIKTIKTEGIV